MASNDNDFRPAWQLQVWTAYQWQYADSANTGRPVRLLADGSDPVIAPYRNV